MNMVALVGDSDIERWPSELLPISDARVILSGHGGITLPDLLPHVEKILVERPQVSDSLGSSCLIIVLCCGENDIGNGISLWNSKRSLQNLLDRIFSCNSNEVSMERYVVFLGPKLEPWLLDDDSSRKDYIKMSMTFKQCCLDHPCCHRIFYVDCLLLFCLKETVQMPGSLHGGRAIPDANFFADDRLHLSIEGYEIWKEVVERYIHKILDPENVRQIVHDAKISQK